MKLLASQKLLAFQKSDWMANNIDQITADALRTLHGARSLSPVDAAEALEPFLRSMNTMPVGDKLADAANAAVTELARSLRENHAAPDDVWQEAIETTLSFLQQRAK
jgi:hypothetical protein